MSEVFISHSSKDMKRIGKLVSSIDSLKNVNVFCSSDSTTNTIEDGSDIYQIIKKNILKSHIVVFILSQNFYESIPSMIEVGIAYGTSGKELIPVVFSEDDYREDLKGIFHQNIKAVFLNDHDSVAEFLYRVAKSGDSRSIGINKDKNLINKIDEITEQIIENMKENQGSHQDNVLLNQNRVVYTEEEHLNKSSEDIVELYNTIKEFILGLDDSMCIKPKKLEIGFAYKNKIMVDIHLQKRALKMWLNASMGTLDDARNIARDVTNIGHWGNGDYEIQISNDNDLEYIFSLIKQLYRIRNI